MKYALNNTDAEYFMFCDQDDVWLENKIERSVSVAMKIPNEELILVHSDLRIVDNELQNIHNSMFDYMALNKFKFGLNLMVQNTVTGCAMLLNRSLINFVKDIPTEANMHDHYIALVAAVFGRIVFIDESLILYRQHSSNVVGATKYKDTFKDFSKNLIKYGLSFFIRKYRWFNVKYQKQALVFLDTYSTNLSNSDKEALSFFINIEKFYLLERFYKLRKYQLLPNGLNRKIKLILGLS